VASAAPAVSEPAAREETLAAAAPAAAEEAAAPDEGDEGGAERAPAIATADMTFPDSSTRLIAPAELETMGPATLKIARNEIFARKGRRFKDPWLREWFGRYAWYRPRFDEVRLNRIEQQNVTTIRRAEARFGG
jgi:hypothetical protein